MSHRFVWQNPYPTVRIPLFARNVVSTSHPLAAQAGLRMLLAGGSAVDAAIAAAAMLTVVEPVSCGLGSDAFAILWDGERLHGLNASGTAPQGWSLGYFRRKYGEDAHGHPKRPTRGWDAVTVPGAISAWAGPARALRQAAVRRCAGAGGGDRGTRPHHRPHRHAQVGSGDPRTARPARLRAGFHAARPRARSGREMRPARRDRHAAPHRRNTRARLLRRRARRTHRRACGGRTDRARPARLPARMGHADPPGATAATTCTRSRPTARALQRSLHWASSSVSTSAPCRSIRRIRCTCRSRR